MKISVLRFGALAMLSATLAIPLATAQSPDRRAPGIDFTRNPAEPALNQTLRGEAQFLERIALPPGAKLHVSLVGRVAGAEYLPLATAIVPARSGITRFALQIPTQNLPAGPYRLQAWIIGDNRALFIGREAQTTVSNLDALAKITLKMAPKLQNIDGIGDGKPLPTANRITLRGAVSKLDRRALLPDSRVELELRDVSLADAPAPLIMGQVIQLEGGQLPRDFNLEIAAADLLPRRRYSLSARVLEAGKLTYISDTLIPVTPENASAKFEIRVVPAAPVVSSP